MPGWKQAEHTVSWSHAQVVWQIGNLVENIGMSQLNTLYMQLFSELIPTEQKPQPNSQVVQC